MLSVFYHIEAMKTMIAVVATVFTVGLMVNRIGGMHWDDWGSGAACGLMVAYWLVRLAKKADSHE